jgi:hypothetical protein
MQSNSGAVWITFQAYFQIEHAESPSQSHVKQLRSMLGWITFQAHFKEQTCCVTWSQNTDHM